jgi:hypothetical protein
LRTVLGTPRFENRKGRGSSRFGLCKKRVGLPAWSVRSTWKLGHTGTRSWACHRVTTEVLGGGGLGTASPPKRDSIVVAFRNRRYKGGPASHFGLCKKKRWACPPFHSPRFPPRITHLCYHRFFSSK